MTIKYNQNMIGIKYNSLTGKEFLGKDSNGSMLWKWLCDCGNEKILPAHRVISGHNLSCGCMYKKANGLHAYNSIISNYKRRAKNLNLEFEIKTEDMLKLFLNNCYYCKSTPNTFYRKSKYGVKFPYNGIDRIDNNDGYTYSNCVTCCKNCNYAKHALSKEKFNEWIYLIKNKMNFDKSYKETKIIKNMVSNGLFHEKKTGAKRTNKTWNLDIDEFLFFTQQNCHYCGIEPKQIFKIKDRKPYTYTYNGLDRVDNSEGYYIENCVPCCITCNRAKGKMLYNDFIKYLNSFKGE